MEQGITTKEQRLSKREREVADLLSEGHHIAAIGARLGIAESTISTHVRRIRAKLGAANTLQAAIIWALRRAHPEIEYLSWGKR